MERKIDEETVGYCLDSILGNLEFMDKRLAELQGALPQDEEFPKRLEELAEETERLYQKVNNRMAGLLFPRI